MMNVPDNKQWFQQFTTGDALAFKHYFDLYNKLLFYLSYRIVGDVAAAEDIVADAYQKLWEHRETIQSEAHVVGFLRVVTRNYSLNHIKHEERKEATEAELRSQYQDIDNSDLARGMIEAELTKKVHHAIEQLPKMCKAVFKQLYFEQASTKEAAERLGISERNVLNQKARAIQLLRGMLPRLE
jgi:RNA polymerase sigma-70 factor (family 1)